ncbi:hypothetical protein ACFQ3P_29845 [Paraburkholderia sabiae]|uniref:Uncharacterized protein n=1 Tax=Paraburkholderia sabiae TaxID=273251 RepID=A0ABU9QHB8_9BURK|nr:hypothetical protein [Paraburkholderia sabiae]WJZ75606.1 hypothetical protein QEN71_07340 [Paraburkholderia sabiae]
MPAIRHATPPDGRASHAGSGRKVLRIPKQSCSGYAVRFPLCLISSRGSPTVMTLTSGITAARRIS